MGTSLTSGARTSGIVRRTPWREAWVKRKAWNGPGDAAAEKPRVTP